MIYRALRSLIFALDAERAHRLTVAALRGLPMLASRFDTALTTELAGLAFPSPIGLAAGFDKDAEIPDAMLSLGFGFVEVGTVTPLPQIGNPKPRLFRLREDEGVINRMGFNNNGQAAAHARLAKRARRGIVGVNIGANKDSTDRIADYAQGVKAMADVADYLTVNISSPNTPGLRGLQDAGELTALLDAINDVRRDTGPPVFLKLAPDLDGNAIDATVNASMGKVAALIIGNTTVSRPPLTSQWKGETGGLSGAPLKSLAAEKLRAFRSATGGNMPLIAAGGIDSAAEAYARIRSGASLVQIYSALVYHGPGLARALSGDLAELLKRDGFAQVADAVGVDAA
jgi:dihydroorotate dehydrogenase